MEEQRLKAFKEKIFSKAKEAGFVDFEIYFSSSSDLEFTIYNQEIDTYNITEQQGLSFRGIYNKKMGNSYTENIVINSADGTLDIEEDVLEVLISQAKQSAMSIENDDEVEIFAGSEKYSEFDGYKKAFSDVPVEEKIKFSKQVEKLAKERDSRITAVNYNIFSEGTTETIILNSKGLCKSSKDNYGLAYVSLIAKEGQDIKTASKLITSKDFKDYDAQKFAYGAADEAISMLGAEAVKSGNYDIIFRNTAMASIISTFLSVFSAESVQKGLSLLKGKLDSKIASEKVTLVDNPLAEFGMNSSPFDDEGVATYKKNIIEKGSLKTFLYDLRTSKKDGVKSTGNGQKGYKSPIGISAFNLYIENGTLSYDELINKVGKGIIVTDVEGLHAGANAITGDFSLAASGYLVEDGKISKPVNGITISGNFYEVLNSIDEIGNDLKFGFPGGAYVGSPSVMVKNLSVAGK